MCLVVIVRRGLPSFSEAEHTQSDLVWSRGLGRHAELTDCTAATPLLVVDSVQQTAMRLAVFPLLDRATLSWALAGAAGCNFLGKQRNGTGANLRQPQAL
ncbi:hypothetical protein NQZ68_003764 [Dissostichus eleginoides]|nr:hypothetical protein NQZ68_003764 [Dissostichus eleginoides]